MLSFSALNLGLIFSALSQAAPDFVSFGVCGGAWVGLESLWPLGLCGAEVVSPRTSVDLISLFIMTGVSF